MLKETGPRTGNRETSAFLNCTNPSQNPICTTPHEAKTRKSKANACPKITREAHNPCKNQNRRKPRRGLNRVPLLGTTLRVQRLSRGGKICKIEKTRLSHFREMRKVAAFHRRHTSNLWLLFTMRDSNRVILQVIGFVAEK